MKRAALLLTALAFLTPAAAEAQCPNGADVCAEVNVSGTVSGSIQIGGTRGRRVVVDGTPARPSRVVLQTDAVPTPQRTVVITTPAPPPPPQGRVVVVRPAPPPPPQPTVVVVEARGTVPPPPQVQLRQPRVQRVAAMDQRFGLHARMGAMMSENVAMGGAHFGLRFRPCQLFAMELGIGGYGGEDYNDDERFELPVTVDGYLFLGRRRFQPYLVGGLHTSVAFVEQGFFGDDRTLVHVGGQLGIGAEWRVGRRLGLSMDVRGFVRERVGGSDERPEFVRPGESTDTSVGALMNLGMTLYL